MDLKYNDKLTKDQKIFVNNLVIDPKPKVKVKAPRQPRTPVDPHRQDPLPNLLTISEVAEYLRIVPLTLKRMEKRGEIKSIRINSRGDRRYTREEIERILKC